MTPTATLDPAATRRIEALTGGAVVRPAGLASRQQPRLCPLCRGPLGRQEDACWRCGAPVPHERFSGGPGPCAAHWRRPRNSEALSASVRRRRASRVHDGRSRDGTLESNGHGAADAAPSRAEDHARWTRERAEASKRARTLTRELAAAIDIGDANWRQLHDRLDEYGARLAVVRLRLYRGAIESAALATLAPAQSIRAALPDHLLAPVSSGR